MIVALLGASDMDSSFLRYVLACVMASALVSGSAIAESVSARRSVGISRSISYSSAKPSYSGAAAKPSSAARPQSPGTGATRTSAPVASVSAASAPARQESSSGSFWTPFVIGYMMAPHGSHAAATSTKPASSAATVATSPDRTNGKPNAPAPAEPARTGPFAINVPESELLDGDCKVRAAAQEFIKGAKIEHSVLFLAAPETSRCGKLRDRLEGQVSPAILVKSDNDHIVLSRMMKQ